MKFLKYFLMVLGICSSLCQASENDKKSETIGNSTSETTTRVEMGPHYGFAPETSSAGSTPNLSITVQQTAPQVYEKVVEIHQLETTLQDLCNQPSTVQADLVNHVEATKALTKEQLFHKTSQLNQELTVAENNLAAAQKSMREILHDLQTRPLTAIQILDLKIEYYKNAIDVQTLQAKTIPTTSKLLQYNNQLLKQHYHEVKATYSAQLATLSYETITAHEIPVLQSAKQEISKQLEEEQKEIEKEKKQRQDIQAKIDAYTNGYVTKIITKVSSLFGGKSLPVLKQELINLDKAMAEREKVISHLSYRLACVDIKLSVIDELQEKDARYVLEQLNNIQKMYGSSAFQTNANRSIAQAVELTKLDNLVARHTTKINLSLSAQKLLQTLEISPHVFADLRTNAYQKHLLEQTIEILNQTGDIFAAYHAHPHISDYAEATAHMCVSTVDSIKYGTMQEATAKFEMTSLLYQATCAAISFAKGYVESATVGTLIDIGLTVFVPQTRVAGLLLKGMLAFEALSFDSTAAINRFLELSFDKKAEAIGSACGLLFTTNSRFGSVAAKNAQKALDSITKVIEREVRALKTSQAIENAALKTANGFTASSKVPFLTSLREISSAKPTNAGATSATASKTAGSTSSAGAKLTELEVKAASEASTIGKTSVLSLETVSLHHLDASVGNVKKLEEAIKMFKDIPGAVGKDGPITKLLETGKAGSSLGSLGTARGAAYELEFAYDLTIRGEKILELGSKLPLKDSTGKVIKIMDVDIVTVDSIIECKNKNWNLISIDEVNNIKAQVGDLNRLANSLNKILKISSKHPMPTTFTNWLKEKKIFFFEGIK